MAPSYVSTVVRGDGTGVAHAGKPHAGKCGELTPSATTGRRWSGITLTSALPTQEFRKVTLATGAAESLGGFRYGHPGSGTRA